MAVRQGVGLDLAPFELSEDFSSVKSRACVEEDAVGEIGVHDIRRESVELLDALGQAFHGWMDSEGFGRVISPGFGFSFIPRVVIHGQVP